MRALISPLSIKSSSGWTNKRISEKTTLTNHNKRYSIPVLSYFFFRFDCSPCPPSLLPLLVVCMVSRSFDSSVHAPVPLTPPASSDWSTLTSPDAPFSPPHGPQVPTAKHTRGKWTKKRLASLQGVDAAARRTAGEARAENQSRRHPRRQLQAAVVMMGCYDTVSPQHLEDIIHSPLVCVGSRKLRPGGERCRSRACRDRPAPQSPPGGARIIDSSILPAQQLSQTGRRQASQSSGLGVGMPEGSPFGWCPYIGSTSKRGSTSTTTPTTRQMGSMMMISRDTNFHNGTRADAWRRPEAACRRGWRRPTQSSSSSPPSGRSGG